MEAKIVKNEWIKCITKLIGKIYEKNSSPVKKYQAIFDQFLH
jgi:hypothetical protein